jgi:hypothetical protein
MTHQTQKPLRTNITKINYNYVLFPPFLCLCRITGLWLLRAYDWRRISSLWAHSHIRLVQDLTVPLPSDTARSILIGNGFSIEISCAMAQEMSRSRATCLLNSDGVFTVFTACQFSSRPDGCLPLGVVRIKGTIITLFCPKI